MVIWPNLPGRFLSFLLFGVKPFQISLEGLEGIIPKNSYSFIPILPFLVKNLAFLNHSASILASAFNFLRLGIKFLILGLFLTLLFGIPINNLASGGSKNSS